MGHGVRVRKNADGAWLAIACAMPCADANAMAPEVDRPGWGGAGC